MAGISSDLIVTADSREILTANGFVTSKEFLQPLRRVIFRSALMMKCYGEEQPDASIERLRTD